MGTLMIIALLAVIVVFAVRSARKHLKGEGGCCGGGADEIIVEKKQLQGTIVGKKNVHIDGMSCDHCRKAVEQQLNRVEGAAAQVDWKNGIAVLSMEREISDEEIRRALAWTDYTVTGIEPTGR